MTSLARRLRAVATALTLAAFLSGCDDRPTVVLGSCTPGRHCTDDSHCGTGQGCAYRLDAGCDAIGECVDLPPPGAPRCQSVRIVTCGACGGGDLAIPCDWPNGYAPMPSAPAPRCEDAGPAD